MFNTQAALANIKGVAAFNNINDRPYVVANTSNGNLYERFVKADGTWQNWQTIANPAGHILSDVDIGYVMTYGTATTDLYGISAATGGWLWRRTRSSTNPYDPWSAWQLLISGWLNDGFQKVAAARDWPGSAHYTFMLNNFGNKIYWMSEPYPWSVPAEFPYPPTSAPLLDIDVGFGGSGQMKLVALDAYNNIWAASKDVEDDSWGSWELWIVPLYVSTNCDNFGPENLVSITLARWWEDYIPVLFVTDTSGNIYYSTWESSPCDACQCVSYSTWRYFRPFYHTRFRDDFN